MSWDTLRPVLLELAERSPRPVRDGPDPHVIGPRRAPFHLRLEAWAADVAELLHRQFRAEVMLSVGYFGYPSMVPVDSRGRPLPGRLSAVPALERATLADPTALTIDLRHPVTVASGHEATVELVVVNQSREPVELLRPRTVVVDPATGNIAGDTMPSTWRDERAYHLAPRAPVVIPVRIGTASRDRSLGYAVSAGEWAFRFFAERSGGQLLRAPLLPVTIT